MPPAIVAIPPITEPIANTPVNKLPPQLKILSNQDGDFIFFSAIFFLQYAAMVPKKDVRFSSRSMALSCNFCNLFFASVTDALSSAPVSQLDDVSAPPIRSKLSLSCCVAAANPDAPNTLPRYISASLLSRVPPLRLRDIIP